MVEETSQLGTSKRMSAKDLGVIAWFNILKKTLDVMPDEPDQLLVSAPLKTTLHKWFVEDCTEWPAVFRRVSESYFLKTWREWCPEVKLRKHMRFTLCEVC